MAADEIGQVIVIAVSETAAYREDIHEKTFNGRVNRVWVAGLCCAMFSTALSPSMRP